MATWLGLGGDWGSCPSGAACPRGRRNTRGAKMFVILVFLIQIFYFVILLLTSSRGDGRREAEAFYFKVREAGAAPKSLTYTCHKFIVYMP